MMLEHLQLPTAAASIREGVARVLRQGAVRTPDLGGRSSTAEVGEAVLATL
jgi:tartrate dehydrogenase/decarboxylase/D-malate dehydrogenase